VLQERLDEKKELLLEKELMLEEVTNLTVKLRNQALGKRDETLHLATRASEFQSKIRNTTRAMMALVAELSMYQATALKLQQEKHLRLGELDMCRTRTHHGEAPSLDAEKELYRQVLHNHSITPPLHNAQAFPKQRPLPHLLFSPPLNSPPPLSLQERLAREREERRQSKERLERQLAQPTALHKTTAEPRPNAYVQEYMGVPKPYGGFAPFKPTEPGSTMRHIRAPQEIEIEI
jgi:hypothetical protein